MVDDAVVLATRYDAEGGEDMRDSMLDVELADDEIRLWDRDGDHGFALTSRQAWRLAQRLARCAAVAEDEAGFPR